MTAIAPRSTSFAYVECDVPAEQTLVEWRRDREAMRAAERGTPRTLRQRVLFRRPR
jgi:hypothetical protein